MRGFLVLMLLAGWIAPAMAWSADTLGLKGLYIGQPLSTVDESVYDCTVAESVGVARCVSKEMLSFGSHGVARLNASFLHGKCVAIFVPDMKSEFFDDLLGYLTAKFGKPTSHDVSDVSTASGATYQNHEVIWDRGTVRGVFRKYAGTIYQSDVSVFDVEAYGDIYWRNHGAL